MTIQFARKRTVTTTILSAIFLGCWSTSGQAPGPSEVAIPKTWDDAIIPTLEVPLANPTGSPKHISQILYKIPVRPIYKQYPVYAPGRGPAGYKEWLEKQDPVLLWDDAGTKPELKSDADWIRAGEMVFSAPLGTAVEQGFVAQADVENEAWYKNSAMPLNKDGALPFVYYTIRQKRKVELGLFAWMCHTRVMRDGTAIRGAQGNFPLERASASSFSYLPAPVLFALLQELYGAPWLHPDPVEKESHVSGKDSQRLCYGATGVNSRHRASNFSPVQIPDLIGVKERHYLDRTGLQPQHSIGDLMRYAALNQGGDFLASFDGFIPADIPEFKKLPDPKDPVKVQGRYSDEQLYALALYLLTQATSQPRQVRHNGGTRPENFSTEKLARCATHHLSIATTN